MPKKDLSGIAKMVEIGSIIHKPKHVLMTLSPAWQIVSTKFYGITFLGLDGTCVRLKGIYLRC